MKERKFEKKRWYWIRTGIGIKDGWKVESQIFYSFDDKFLYERSGKRTPRDSSWRTWYDSETKAVGTFFSKIGRWIASHERALREYKPLQKHVAVELNRLIDAEHGGHS